MREIVITGNSKISTPEIIKRSGIRAGSTSMLFSTSKAKKSIFENPWASDVKMKKLLHGKIEIEISENEPFCVVALQGVEPHYIDGKGKKLGAVEPSQGLDFPVISSEGEISSGLMLQAIEVLNLSRSQFGPWLVGNFRNSGGRRFRDQASNT